MNLRAARKHSGMTQEELAAKAAITREYLARLETGRQDPRVSVIHRIARALGTTVDTLMSTRRRMSGTMTTRGPNKQNFEDALTATLVAATQKGHTHIDVKAGSLHRRVGGYPTQDGDHRMPLCCEVMRRRMRQGDEIVQEPPKGQGATFTVRYRLPR